MQGNLVIRVVLLAVCLLVGSLLLGPDRRASVAFPTEGQGPAGSAETGSWHVVRTGEDLRSIARRWYGSTRQWRTIQNANGVGMHPAVGQRLWIPAALPELSSTIREP